ncbi:MAG TPA: DUF444 family protein [Steroidobacteraceae bacterium]|nr:DUF444 family protein [Steroidobacteraceae bacterium]
MTDDGGDVNLSGWYDLFSRGARDWLRHNDKVRDAVREHLPRAVGGADVISGGASTVRVPVRMLEHYRFRLRPPDQVEGVGQGKAKPGDRIATADDGSSRGQGSGGGDDDGGIEYTLEFQIDDIVDWLWEEMELPNLEQRTGQSREEDWVREGWDRRGARSRLDRRRSLKESIKRHAVQQDSPTFTDDDLRYRQLAKREQPTTQAVVFFVLDVSASMGEKERRLAKTFFFWAAQGLRRAYRHLEIVFVAHTTSAWTFDEQEFFQVSGSGGTFASTGFEQVREQIESRFSPAQYNVYLFYASDGENSPSDTRAARDAIDTLMPALSYAGFLEVGGRQMLEASSEIARLFGDLAAEGNPASAFRADDADDIWAAVRHFFGRQAEAA